MRKGQKKESSEPVEIVRPTTIRDGVFVFLTALIIYILTMPRSVTFEDSGLFIMAAKYWGVAHPPGYPLYTLLGHLFSYIPVSTLGFRVSLLSGMLGAGTALVCYLLFLKWTGFRALSATAAIVLAVSSTVWSQMIVAEVYALHLFLTVLLAYLFLSLRTQLSTGKALCAGLVLGLGLSNHWPLLVLSGPGFLFLVEKKWLQSKYLLRFAIGLVIGLLPYLLMYYRSKQDPMIAFLGPIESISELFGYVLRSYYSGADKSVLYTWRDGWAFFQYFLECLTYLDFAPLLLPLAIWGGYRLYKIRAWHILGFSLFLFLSSSFILLFFLQLEHNDLNRNIMRVFWLGPFFAFSVLFVAGAMDLEKRRQYLGCMILIFAIFFQILFNFQKNNMRNDFFAENYGRTVLSGVPDGEVLFASTDGDVGPTSYVHLGLGEKPNLKMYTGTGVFFKNRVHDPNQKSSDARLKAVVEFINQHERVYSIKNLPVFGGQKQMPVGFMFNGLLYEYSRSAVTPTEPPPESLKLAEMALDGYITNSGIDNWTFHRETLAARLCNFLVLKGVEAHPIFQHSPGCLQVLARHQMRTGRREEADKNFLAWHKKLKFPVTREKQDFLYHFMVNRLEIINSLVGQRDRQMQLLNEALAIVIPTIYEYPLCDSMTGPLLNSLKATVQFQPAVLKQLAIFDDCDKDKKDK